MNNPNEKPVKLGYRYGIILLVFGMVMSGVNVGMLFFGSNYFPKMLTLGIALTLSSLIFFVFPGGTITGKIEGREMNKVLWKNAPGLHKVMWMVWTTISIVIAVLFLLKFDPEFFR